MFDRHLIISAFGLAALAIPAFAQAPAPVPPDAPQIPYELEAHGDVRIDEYYWMRDREDPDVIAYLEAENAYARAVLTPYRGLENGLFAEMTARLSEAREVSPWRDRGYVYGQRYAHGQEYPVYWRHLDEEGAPEEVLIDGPAEAEGQEFYAIGEWNVAPTNDIMGYTTDLIGRRIYTLRFRDLETGELLPDEITGIDPDFAFTNDGRAVYYLRKDLQSLRPFQVYRHLIGTDPAEDELVYQEDDERFFMSVSRTRSGDHVMVGSYFYPTMTEFRFFDANDNAAEGVVLSPRTEGHEHYADHYDGAFWVLSNNDAENFHLLRADALGQPVEEWTEIIGHRDDVLLEGFELFEDRFVLQERADANVRIRAVAYDGSDDHLVDVGAEAYYASIGGIAPDVINPDPATDVLRFGFESLITPETVYAYDMGARELTQLRQEEVLGGFDAADYAIARTEAVARDGSVVPVTLAWRSDMRTEGEPQPLLLLGYGSYGSSFDPTFAGWLVSLYDRGFIVAIAHIRGGQERGRPWYDQGRLMHKMNTFTDYIDVADHLVAQGYTTSDLMFARGRSAGGLLMGAVVNMRPELFEAALVGVPFVDVVTTMLDETIPLTTFEYDEWGNPNEEEAYRYMLAYSPYDQVSAQEYPNLYVTAGLHDSQVQYWEPAKWVARLRDYALGDNLILLDTNMEAGHGGASGRFRIFRERAREVAFVLSILGRTENDPALALGAAADEPAVEEAVQGGG